MASGSGLLQDRVSAPRPHGVTTPSTNWKRPHLIHRSPQLPLVCLQPPTAAATSSSRRDSGIASTSYSQAPLHTPQGSTLPHHTSTTTRRQASVACQARGRGDGPEDWRSSQSGYSARRKGGKFEVNVNGQQYSIGEGNLVLFSVMALGLAAVLGPLIIGITVAAVAVGAALSMGAVALSMFWIPFAMMFGFMALSVLVPFGGFAVVGLGLFFPKVLSLMIAGGGIALGWAIVRNLLPGARVTTATPPPSTFSSTGSGSGAGGKDAWRADGPVVQADSRSLSSEDEAATEAEIRRMSQELKEFDTMMADREEEKRMDEWRKRKMGR